MKRNGEIIPARKKNPFRGTTNYASLVAHEERDLSRKDDLWSLFLVLADMMLGKKNENFIPKQIRLIRLSIDFHLFHQF